MAIIKRHWKASIILMLLLGCAGMLFLVHPYTSQHAMAVDTEASEPIAPAVELSVDDYNTLARLRKELHMSDEDLAAMGCDETSARRVLQSLHVWQQSNKVLLTSANDQVRRAHKELRETMRQVNVGPRNETALAKLSTCRRDLGDAFEARKTILNNASSAIASQLSYDQNQAWAARKQNMGVRGCSKYLTDLSAEQKTAIAERFSTEDLTYTQRTQLGTIRSRVRQNLAGVQNASKEVMPLPQEILDQIARDSNEAYQINQR